MKFTLVCAVILITGFLYSCNKEYSVKDSYLSRPVDRVVKVKEIVEKDDPGTTYWTQNIAGKNVEITFCGRDYDGLYIYIIKVENESFLFMSANGEGATSQRLKE